MAEAATRIRTQGDDVGTGAGRPRSSLLGLQVVIAVLVLGLAVVGFFWWRASEPVRQVAVPRATNIKTVTVVETGPGKQKPVEPEVQVTKPVTPVNVTKPRPPVISHKPAVKQAVVTKRPKVKTGQLTFDTKPWTEVYMGKRKLGITPLLKIELPAGRHELTLVNQGRGIHEKIKVTITAGELATVRKVLGK